MENSDVAIASLVPCSQAQVQQAMDDPDRNGTSPSQHKIQGRQLVSQQFDQDGEKHGATKDSKKLNNRLSQASPQPEVGDDEDQPRPSLTSESQEELQLKQQVAKRIEREEALILENEMELEKIKREAEEKAQNLNERIRTRQSKVEILKELLET